VGRGIFKEESGLSKPLKFLFSNKFYSVIGPKSLYSSYLKMGIVVAKMVRV
jgi:hypothetical protein